MILPQQGFGKRNRPVTDRGKIKEGTGEGAMKIRVICYEGYAAEETPRAFTVGNRRIEVVEILDRWRGEDHEYFKVIAPDGDRYILRRDRESEEWEITQFTSGVLPRLGR
jgi:hypothetical protein